MTYYKHIVAAIALALSIHITAHSQIINDWSTGTTLPGQNDNGLISTVGDGKNASFDQFLDWENTLGDFADIKTVSEEELKARMKKQEMRQNSNNLPSYIDENGIDLYLLTEEGINNYLKMLTLSYGQECTQDIIKWIRYYAYNKRAGTKKMFKRYEKWQPYIEACFEQFNVPKDISILCLIESACTYSALSKAGALGMWQIMPATGKQFGLKIDDKTDERKDPVLSTEVAAKILAYNYNKSKDWTLAIAGYNCGIGRVSDIANRKATQSWPQVKNSLPKETQQYIPSLIAIYYTWHYRKQLNI